MTQTMNELPKPISRNKLRRNLGREFYILKRRWKNYKSNQPWATQKSDFKIGAKVFSHRSMILRPLKDVDMYLQENKRTNLALAISPINDLVIKPGEIFSIWHLVGRPTKRKGYLDGLVLSQGEIKKGIGGGLCQLGNLLFWIFAHSELTITERYRHGFDVFPDVNRKIPFGAGATLAYNYVDLQVKNNTKSNFQLNLWLDDTHLNGTLLCDIQPTSTIKVEERNHLIKQQYWGGYSRHNQVYQIKNFGQHQEESLLVENHAIMMYNPFLSPKQGEDTNFG